MTTHERDDSEVVRGRFAAATSAPAEGEHVEHILSGRLGAPVDYVQDHDEWVVVLEGSASLDVSGETVSLSTGDWLLLPEGTPHRLVQDRAGNPLAGCALQDAVTLSTSSLTHRR